MINIFTSTISDLLSMCLCTEVEQVWRCAVGVSAQTL